MATTSGCRSSARRFLVRLLDICCDNQTQENISWFLKLQCLPFLLLGLVVTTGSVLLLLRFTISPQIKAYVEDARLNSFDLAGPEPPFSAYNISISVALTVRSTMDIKYTKPLVATFLFYDRNLYNVTVADKGRKQKALKRRLHLLHTGVAVPYVLDTEAAQEFKKQNSTGLFKVEMRLSGEIMHRVGNKRGLELSCPLTLHRPPPGRHVVVFHEVDCKPDKPKKIIF